MVRKLAVSLAVAAALTHSAVLGLGLGDISSKSRLNQPLEAEIELLSAGDLTQADIDARLADFEAYLKNGVTRTGFQSKIKFEVVGTGNSKFIKITTREPVKEPFLNFLLELNWPNGKLLREYTLLLDPPVFSAGDSSVVTTTTTSERQAPTTRTAERPQTRSRPAAANPRPRAARRAPINSNAYTTQRNDTLWSIAARSRPSDAVTTRQTMIALFERNPDAFINGNIDRLKRGVELDIPSEQIISQVPRGARVSSPQAAPRAAVDARRDASGVTPTNTGGGQLTLAAPPDEAAAADAAEKAALEAEVESLRKMVKELRERVRDGNSAGSDAALNIGDEDLATIGGNDDQAEPVAELQPLEAASEEPGTDLTGLDTDTNSLANTDEGSSELPAESATEADDSNTAAAATTPPPAAEKPVVDNVRKAPKRKAPGFFEQYGLWLLVGAAALLIAGLLFFMRSRRQDEDLSLADLINRNQDDDFAASSESVTPEGDELLAGLDDDAPVSKPADEQFDSIQDPMGEAEILVAYEKYDEAESILLEALEREPAKHECRIKLMEIYSLTGAEDRFESQREALADVIESDPTIEQHIKALSAKIYKTAEPVPAAAVAAALPSEDDIFAESEDDSAADSGSDDLPESLDDIETGAEAITEAAEDVEEALEDNVIEFESLEFTADDAAADIETEGSDDADGNEIDFSDEDDEVSTKLDLARAYIDMGDDDAAKDILNEVVEQGNDRQKADAEELLGRL